MAKMRPILPASARVQRVPGAPHAADRDGDEVMDGLAASERDADADAGSSDNDDASESNELVGGARPARRKLLWPDTMLDEMLRMRFADPSISSAIEGATSNGQKAAAWRHFAAVLSDRGSARVTERQLRLKFAKIKWEYKRWYETEHSEEERRAMGRPPSYMPILRRWFGAQHRGGADVAGRPRLASDTGSAASTAASPPQLEEAARRHASSADAQEQSDDAASQHGPRLEPPAPGAQPTPAAADGVTLLAQEAGRGMTAIAKALKSRSADAEVAALLQTHHREQMAAMRAMLDAQRAQNELLERIAAALANN